MRGIYGMMVTNREHGIWRSEFYFRVWTYSYKIKLLCIGALCQLGVFPLPTSKYQGRCHKNSKIFARGKPKDCSYRPTYAYVEGKDC